MNSFCEKLRKYFNFTFITLALLSAIFLIVSPTWIKFYFGKFTTWFGLWHICRNDDNPWILNCSSNDINLKSEFTVCRSLILASGLACFIEFIVVILDLLVNIRASIISSVILFLSTCAGIFILEGSYLYIMKIKPYIMDEYLRMGSEMFQLIVMGKYENSDILEEHAIPSDTYGKIEKYANAAGYAVVCAVIIHVSLLFINSLYLLVNHIKKNKKIHAADNN